MENYFLGNFTPGISEKGDQKVFKKLEIGQKSELSYKFKAFLWSDRGKRKECGGGLFAG